MRNLSREELLDKIEECGIQEYGLCGGSLRGRIGEAAAKMEKTGGQGAIVCALNNADLDGILLDLLKDEPEKVMNGIDIAALALGAEKKTLHIPEYAQHLADDAVLTEMLGQHQISLEVGIVDVRADAACLLLHLVTAVELAEAFAQDAAAKACYYVSVNGKKLQRVEGSARIAELADIGDAKVLRLGYAYYPAEAAQLTVAEARIENGVIAVLPSGECIVRDAQEQMTASRKQSCGKCVFCREGLLQLQFMQKEIAEGRGKMDYLDLTEEIGSAMTFSGMCTLGQTAPKLALSAVSSFREEYEGHIRKKKCSAGACFSAETYYIDPKLCTGCGYCSDVCPQDCIEGKAKYIHMIDTVDCGRCGKCLEACGDGAVVRTEGKLPKLPNRLTKVGKFRR
ncbi:MAG: 4Fe-4S binding protein [Lachnospiraceae bacterium]|nr:4Fe-4S binding protein [Lachnospiraceae bacterium]